MAKQVTTCNGYRLVIDRIPGKKSNFTLTAFGADDVPHGFQPSGIADRPKLARDLLTKMAAWPKFDWQFSFDDQTGNIVED